MPQTGATLALGPGTGTKPTQNFHHNLSFQEVFCAMAGVFREVALAGVVTIGYGSADGRCGFMGRAQFPPLADLALCPASIYIPMDAEYPATGEVINRGNGCEWRFEKGLIPTVRADRAVSRGRMFRKHYPIRSPTGKTSRLKPA